MAIAITAACVVLGGLSVWWRARRKYAIRRSAIPEEMAPSPLSESLKELLAVAGGLYLAMLMLTSFLQLDVPEKVVWNSIHFEPLAAIAFALAVIQPLIRDLAWFRRRH